MLNDQRIAQAENSLKQFGEVDNHNGKRFLTNGSGNVLFSLAVGGDLDREITLRGIAESEMQQSH